MVRTDSTGQGEKQGIQLGAFVVIQRTGEGGSDQGGRKAGVRNDWILDVFLKVVFTDFLMGGMGGVR